MPRIKKKKEKVFGPVSVIILLTLAICVLSFFVSVLGLESHKTLIANGTLESSLINVKNMLSMDGLKFFIGNVITNFSKFEPLVLIIIVSIGIGICEKSGLIYAIVSPLKRVKMSIIIYFTFFIGIIASFIGDYSYVLFIPLVGVIFKDLQKNPMIGILTVFLGLTVGYGTGVIFNYNDYTLGQLTQAAASLDVDKNYGFGLFSNIYIMVVSTFILSFFGTIIIEKFLVPKFTKKYTYEEEELIVSKKALSITTLISVLLWILVIYFLIPLKLPGAGILLDTGADRYMDKLFGSGSAFKEGILVIITTIMMICSYIYGKLSGNIKNSTEYSLGLSKNLENLGFIFVLMFFTSQMVAILDWTNLGEFVCAKIVEITGNLQFSGILLVVFFVLGTIVSGFLLPGTMEKWQLMSPTIVPLFMRSNITPDFTQFIFKVADGIGKCFTPLFVYFMVMLAFLEKYRVSEKNQISIFGTIKSIMPTVLLLTFIWLLVICLWYLIGIPIGVGTMSTL